MHGTREALVEKALAEKLRFELAQIKTSRAETMMMRMFLPLHNILLLLFCVMICLFSGSELMLPLSLAFLVTQAFFANLSVNACLLELGRNMGSIAAASDDDVKEAHAFAVSIELREGFWARAFNVVFGAPFAFIVLVAVFFAVFAATELGWVNLPSHYVLLAVAAFAAGPAALVLAAWLTEDKPNQ